MSNELYVEDGKMEVRYVHVVSDELLGVRRRANEKQARFEYRQREYDRRRLFLDLLSRGFIEMENGVTDEVEPPNFKKFTDVNWRRRYTYGFVFPYEESGDYDTVVVAIARQADEDPFIRSRGREIVEGRIETFLLNKENGVDSNSRHVHEFSFSEIDRGVSGLPVKVVNAVSMRHRQLTTPKEEVSLEVDRVAVA